MCLISLVKSIQKHIGKIVDIDDENEFKLVRFKVIEMENNIKLKKLNYFNFSSEKFEYDAVPEKVIIIKFSIKYLVHIFRLLKITGIQISITLCMNIGIQTLISRQCVQNCTYIDNSINCA